MLTAPARASVPSGFVESTVLSGINAPTAMAFGRDGRLFVCEQGGTLRVIRSGRLLPEPFVRVTVDSSGERGLLGVALDPDFVANKYVYVYYTATTPVVHNRISRFTAQGDIAEPGSEFAVLDLDPLSSATNHNGGAIHFGPDGKLYAAVGDNANGGHAQSLENLLGKVLRINKDGSIPGDNPFMGSTTGKNRTIWALGLRNPFTFAFDTAGGRLFVNDVGQSTWEEINHGIAGSNYGWPATEGPTTDPRYRSPLLSYGHGAGAATGCAIVGAAFYDPAKGAYPTDFGGDYFFADLCSGWIRRFDASLGTNSGFVTGVSQPVDLAVGPEGDLYFLARGRGGYLGRVSTDLIFADGFESGDSSAWSRAATGRGDLSVTTAAALAGTSQGLEARVNDRAALYVRDDTPNDESRYRARFYFDPNGFDPGEASRHFTVTLFLALEQAPTNQLVKLMLERRGGAYKLGARVRLDDGKTAATPFVGVTDDPHLVELDWRRATGPSTHDGGLQLWIDGELVASLSGLDNDEGAVDSVRLGAMAIRRGAAGTLYFDEFESRRLSPIGP